MLRLDLDRLVRLRGKTNVVEYLVTHGKFSRSVARRLADPNVKSWRPQHLDRLCALFQCDRNTLIVYVGDPPAYATPEGQEERVEVESLDRLLKDLPTKDLVMIYKMIKEVRDGRVK